MPMWLSRRWEELTEERHRPKHGCWREEQRRARGGEQGRVWRSVAERGRVKVSREEANEGEALDCETSARAEGLGERATDTGRGGSQYRHLDKSLTSLSPVSSTGDRCCAAQADRAIRLERTDACVRAKTPIAAWE